MMDTKICVDAVKNNEEPVIVSLDRYNELLDCETRLDVLVSLIKRDLNSRFIERSNIETYLYCAGFGTWLELIKEKEMDEYNE